jgi:hypothetical protein
MKKVKIPSKPKYNRIGHAPNTSLEHYHYKYEFTETFQKRKIKRLGAMHDV